MPTFDVTTDEHERLEIEAESWMTALTEALPRLEIGPDEAVDCDLSADGDIRVRVNGRGFVLRERVGTTAQVAVGGVTLVPRLGALVDLPSATAASFLDAPDPDATPAWSVMDDRGEDLLERIELEVDAIAAAETAEDACALGLDLLMRYVPAESGAVLVLDRAGKDLRFLAARGPRSRGLVGMDVPVGKGIAGVTVRGGVAMHLREVGHDPRHYGEVDRRTGYATHAMVSVPLRNSRATVGCLQLLNPFAGVAFADWHRAAAQIVAATIAARIE